MSRPHLPQNTPGRPAGAWAYETIARSMQGRDDVWVTTRDEIAASVRKWFG